MLLFLVLFFICIYFFTSCIFVRLTLSSSLKFELNFKLNAFVMLSLNSLNSLSAFVMLSLNSLRDRAFLLLGTGGCLSFGIKFPGGQFCIYNFPPSCVLLSGLFYILGYCGSCIGWHGCWKACTRSPRSCTHWCFQCCDTGSMLFQADCGNGAISWPASLLGTAIMGGFQVSKLVSSFAKLVELVTEMALATGLSLS